MLPMLKIKNYQKKFQFSVYDTEKKGFQVLPILVDSYEVPKK